jgi:hypothetical protein
LQAIATSFYGERQNPRFRFLLLKHLVDFQLVHYTLNPQMRETAGHRSVPVHDHPWPETYQRITEPMLPKEGIFHDQERPPIPVASNDLATWQLSFSKQLSFMTRLPA